MKTLSRLILVFLLVVVVVGTAFADPTTLTAVQLSPDLRVLTVTFQGQPGKHSAFVIENPSRLVIDFDETALARITTRVPVHREPVDMIRIGQENGRARVVVDFGNHPVPPFKLDRRHDSVVVHLGSGSIGGRPAPPKQQQAQAVKPKPPTARESRLNSPPAKRNDLNVKSAGIAENLIYVEVTDEKDPKRAYRLVFDLDKTDFSVRGATVSDPTGSVRRFHLVSSESTPQAKVDSLEKKETPPAVESSPSGKGKFKWGLQSGPQTGLQSDDEFTEQESMTRGPLKMERFQLKPRQSAQTN
ncbi:AMIN domain-containing protein [Desulfomonile tiedjei]|uniref:Localisation of periplasmic protein complexes n=1 Tax=Desulfomonile tiedjei (strain ATCC 49306 / DSM 6799 / DCB-1) TaxID=706587 RepID=I4C6Z7_DESTA|nr:AMIN domain-containing protein [Desulfomonile tiedjei]AFM25338.1 Localisation of periplasmic protein complexes [Desulfomonile tiedjei DSM 6799]